MQLAHHTGTAKLHHAEVIAQGALEIEKAISLVFSEW